MDKVQRSLPTSAQALKLQKEHLERNALFLVKDAYINEIRRSQYVDVLRSRRDEPTLGLGPSSGPAGGSALCMHPPPVRQLGCLLWTLLLLAGLFVWYIIQMPNGRYRMNSAVVDLF